MTKTEKALAARTLYWRMVGDRPPNGSTPSPESLAAWEAVVGMLTDPDVADGTETVTIDPDGISVDGVHVPGAIDDDSVYVKPYTGGIDLFGVTLTIMAGKVNLIGGVKQDQFVGRHGHKVRPRRPNE